MITSMSLNNFYVPELIESFTKEEILFSFVLVFFLLPAVPIFISYCVILVKALIDRYWKRSDRGVHKTTDWEISTNSSFSQIVNDSYTNPTNASDLTLPVVKGIDKNTKYYIRTGHSGKVSSLKTNNSKQPRSKSSQRRKKF